MASSADTACRPAGERRFSLFNVSRWKDERPSCCSVVPVLYEGPFSTEVVSAQVERLRTLGSLAAPFMDPEGLIVYHTAAQHGFKVTLKDDDKPKGQVAV